MFAFNFQRHPHSPLPTHHEGRWNVILKTPSPQHKTRISHIQTSITFRNKSTQSSKEYHLQKKNVNKQSSNKNDLQKKHVHKQQQQRGKENRTSKRQIQSQGHNKPNHLLLISFDVSSRTPEKRESKASTRPTTQGDLRKRRGEGTVWCQS